MQLQSPYQLINPVSSNKGPVLVLLEFSVSRRQQSRESAPQVSLQGIWQASTPLIRVFALLWQANKTCMPSGPQPSSTPVYQFTPTCGLPLSKIKIWCFTTQNSAIMSNRKMQFKVKLTIIKLVKIEKSENIKQAGRWESKNRKCWSIHISDNRLYL